MNSESISAYRLTPAFSGPWPCHEFKAVDLKEVGGRPDLKGSSLWMEGNDGTNELDFQRSLAHERNRAVLSLLAGEPSANVVRVIREIGGSGNLDLAATLKSGTQEHLLLLDCKSGDVGKGPRRGQYVQAVRLALSALPSLVGQFCAVGAVPHLGTLSPWSGDRTPTALEGRLPEWIDRDGRRHQVPKPAEWSFVVLAAGDERFVLLAPLEALDLSKAFGFSKTLEESIRTGRDNELAGAAGRKAAQAIPLGLQKEEEDTHPLRVWQHGDSAVAQLRIEKRAHVALMRGKDKKVPEVSTLRRIREQAYANETPKPWEFLGESNEKGKVRLHWRAKATGKQNVEPLKKVFEGFVRTCSGG